MIKNFVNSQAIKELKSEKFDWSIIPSAKGVYIVVYDNVNTFPISLK